MIIKPARAPRLARLHKEQMGLLDTGATHAMRGKTYRYREILLGRRTDGSDVHERSGHTDP